MTRVGLVRAVREVRNQDRLRVNRHFLAEVVTKRGVWNLARMFPLPRPLRVVWETADVQVGPLDVEVELIRGGGRGHDTGSADLDGDLRVSDAFALIFRAVVVIVIPIVSIVAFVILVPQKEDELRRRQARARDHHDLTEYVLDSREAGARRRRRDPDEAVVEILRYRAGVDVALPGFTDAARLHTTACPDAHVVAGGEDDVGIRSQGVPDVGPVDGASEVAEAGPVATTRIHALDVAARHGQGEEERQCEQTIDT